MLSTGERHQQPIQTPAAVDSSLAPISKVSPFNHTAVPMRSEKVNPKEIQHIWVVTGPAGSGKSTIGRYLQQELGVPFLEGDDFHSKANKEKMSNGIPLTDTDRWDWLISLRDAATTALSPSEANNFHPPSGVVVACSALKQKYRDVMRVAAYGSPSVQIHFIYLKLDETTLFQRVSSRQAHYMKPGMVHSQLKDLEEPKREWDALIVDVKGSPSDVQKEVSRVVAAKLAEYQ